MVRVGVLSKSHRLPIGASADHFREDLYVTAPAPRRCSSVAARSTNRGFSWGAGDHPPRKQERGSPPCHNGPCQDSEKKRTAGMLSQFGFEGGSVRREADILDLVEQRAVADLQELRGLDPVPAGLLEDPGHRLTLGR